MSGVHPGLWGHRMGSADGGRVTLPVALSDSALLVPAPRPAVLWISW